MDRCRCRARRGWMPATPSDNGTSRGAGHPCTDRRQPPCRGRNSICSRTQRETSAAPSMEK
jgi:hypothetical protein